MYRFFFRLIGNAAAVAAFVFVANPASARDDLVPLPIESLCIGLLGTHLGEVLEIKDCLNEPQPGGADPANDPGIPNTDPRKRNLHDLAAMDCEGLNRFLTETNRRLGENVQSRSADTKAMAGLMAVLSLPSPEADLFQKWTTAHTLCMTARSDFAEAMLKAMQSCGSPDAQERADCRADAVDAISPKLVVAQHEACRADDRANQAYWTEHDRIGAIRQAISVYADDIRRIDREKRQLERTRSAILTELADRATVGECQ